MYGRPTLQRTSSEFLSDLLSSPDVMSPPLNFLLSPVSQLAVANSVLHSGSGNLNSPTSVASFIRSVSSHSLHSSLYDFNDSDSGPVRRVFSTGDLHQVQHCGGSPLSNESNAIIDGMSRACPYTPQEKKERILRYRSKRKLRNFNKKIKYACRKTLADNRPRIRGRFIRNKGIENNPQAEWTQEDGEEDDMNWISFLDIHSQQTLTNP